MDLTLGEKEQSNIPIFRIEDRNGMNEKIASQFNNKIEKLACIVEKFCVLIDDLANEEDIELGDEILFTKWDLIEGLRRFSTIGALPEKLHAIDEEIHL